MSGAAILIDTLLQSIFGLCILVCYLDDRVLQPKLVQGRYYSIQLWISRSGILLFHID